MHDTQNPVSCPTALMQIREKLKSPNSASLKRPLFSSGEDQLHRFLGFLADKQPIFDYRDVPVAVIAGTQHKSYAASGKNWLDGLAGITGENGGGVPWDDRALRYFESELYETKFPCDVRSTTLTLESWGGAVFSSNGAHRLVAAVCWLTATLGPTAVLRKAPFTYRALNAKAVAMMVAAAREKQEIAYAEHGRGWLIRLGGARTARYLYVANQGAKPEPVARRNLYKVIDSDNVFDSPTDEFLNLKQLQPEVAFAIAYQEWLV